MMSNIGSRTISTPANTTVLGYSGISVFVIRPTTERVWHKAFLGGSGSRAGAHTHPAFPKKASSPVGTPPGAGQ